MITCPACHREVPETSTVECPFCGVVFAKWRGHDGLPSGAPPHKNLQPIIEEARRQRWKLYGALIFYSVVGIAAMIFFLSPGLPLYIAIIIYAVLPPFFQKWLLRCPSCGAPNYGASVLVRGAELETCQKCTVRLLPESQHSPESPPTPTWKMWGALGGLGLAVAALFYLTDCDELDFFRSREDLFDRSIRHVKCQWLQDEATILDRLIHQLRRSGHDTEAIPFAVKLLELREKARDPNRPDVAAALSILATLYQSTYQYAQAEPLRQRALAIYEKARGADHPDVAYALDALATLYHHTGQYAKSEPLRLRVLAILEKTRGPDDPSVASTLDALGLLYTDTGQYAKAESLYQRALTIWEKQRGPDTLAIANSFHNLGWLYRVSGDYAKAEPLLQRALTIQENALGPDDPTLSYILNSLGMLYVDSDQNQKAEALLQRALTLREKASGPDHPALAFTLDGLGILDMNTGQSQKAEPLLQRALAIRQKTLGPDHPLVAQSLNSLALLYTSMDRYEQAEPLFQRALLFREKILGPDHPDVAQSLNGLGMLYAKAGQTQKAEPLLQQARAIRERSAKPDRPAGDIVAGSIVVGKDNRTEQLEPEITGRDGAPMVLVPAGEFLFGDDKVRLSLPSFYIDTYEVSAALYAKFLAVTRREEPDHWSTDGLLKTATWKKFGDRPVIGVTWYDADTYCRQFGKRLPTEQEWEKAARGMDGRMYPWGNVEPSATFANFGHKRGFCVASFCDVYEQQLKPVNSHPEGKSPYGVYNMGGNVWEWTSSGRKYGIKNFRGGSVFNDAASLRVSIRNAGYQPGAKDDDLGFRCVQDAAK